MAWSRDAAAEAGEDALPGSKDQVRMRRHGDGLLVEFESVEDATPFVMRWLGGPLPAGQTVGDAAVWSPGMG